MTNIAFLFGVREFERDAAGERVEAIEHAASNVEALSALLANEIILGAEIVAPPNPTNDCMIEELVKHRQARKRYDTSILYICTHGKAVNGAFHIFGSNVKKGFEDALALDFAKVREPFTKIQAQNRIIILDACYSGMALGKLADPADALVKVKEESINVLSDAAKTDKLRERAAGGGFAICSSSAELTSDATGVFGAHTAFTGALLEAMKLGDRENRGRKLTLAEIAETTRTLLGSDYPEPQYKDVNGFGAMPLIGNYLALEAPLGAPAVLDADPDDFQNFVPDDARACCIVIESMSETALKQNQRLSIHAESALAKFQDALNAAIEKKIDPRVTVNTVDRVFGSIANYENTILALCRAEMAIFDVTGYEPGVMLLLGIRAVARRGVTIASLGGDFVMGDPLDYPFNLREVNIISHSTKQESATRHPIDVIGEKLLSGFEHLGHGLAYLDLPAFDAIRALPPKVKDRAPKDYRTQILALCPFSDSYTSKNWQRFLLPQLATRLPAGENGHKSEILRTLDMKSPRLVSQSLYEAIRLTQMCVVDWTEVRPNVFFELGVRLAAVDIDPVHIVAEPWDEMLKADATKDELTARIAEHLGSGGDDSDRDLAEVARDAARLFDARTQLGALVRLFRPMRYSVRARLEREDLKGFAAIVEHHEAIMKGEVKPEDAEQLTPSFTYGLVSTHLDPEIEDASVAIHTELIQAADLLNDAQIDSHGRSPLLYPGNPEISGRATKAALERRLAAWYYIDGRLRGVLETDVELRRETIHLGNMLMRELRRSEGALAEAIRARVKELRSVS